jgi:hypothetical protein
VYENIGELIKIVIFYEKHNFTSIYITLTFRCMKFEVRYLRKAAKLISRDPAPFTAFFYTFEPNY